jgi:putative FmdB family regulatory protein
MPIYEFYCIDCHTIFNFLSKRPDTTKRPACPRCGREDLDRRMSRSAISKGRTESVEGDDPFQGMDEAKMERVLAELASESEGINEDDPRQAARVMRKLYESTGMQLGAGMEEAMRRMEAGEDPDTIEQELGDLLDSEESMFTEGRPQLGRLSRKLRPPNVDDTLYDL